MRINTITIGKSLTEGLLSKEGSKHEDYLVAISPAKHKDLRGALAGLLLMNPRQNCKRFTKSAGKFLTPCTKNVTPDSHQGRPMFQCNFIVAAHTHGEFGKLNIVGSEY